MTLIFDPLAAQVLDTCSWRPCISVVCAVALCNLHDMTFTLNEEKTDSQTTDAK